jgi:hypothetical protein
MAWSPQVSPWKTLHQRFIAFAAVKHRITIRRIERFEGANQATDVCADSAAVIIRESCVNANVLHGCQYSGWRVNIPDKLRYQDTTA